MSLSSRRLNVHLIRNVSVGGRQCVVPEGDRYFCQEARMSPHHGRCPPSSAGNTEDQDRNRQRSQ